MAFFGSTVESHDETNHKQLALASHQDRAVDHSLR